MTTSVPSRFLLTIALVLVALLAGGAKSCGTDIDAKGPGEPCTRDSECRSDLSCVGGECTAPIDAGAEADGGAADGGAVPTDGAALDALEPVDAAVDGSG